jgi:hypothetical protein
MIAKNILRWQKSFAAATILIRGLADCQAETEEYPEGSAFSGCEGTSYTATLAGSRVQSLNYMVGISYRVREIICDGQVIIDESYSF